MARVLEVECHRSFVPVQGSEILAEPVGQRRPAPHRVSPVRVLNLDDVRSHIREKHPAERAGSYVAEFDDAHAAERKHCALHVEHSGQLLTDNGRYGNSEPSSAPRPPPGNYVSRSSATDRRAQTRFRPRKS